jgi:hypothetical protein
VSNFIIKEIVHPNKIVGRTKYDDVGEMPTTMCGSLVRSSKA